MPRCVFYPRDKLDLNKHELQAYYHNEANRIDRSGEIYIKRRRKIGNKQIMDRLINL